MLCIMKQKSLTITGFHGFFDMHFDFSLHCQHGIKVGVKWVCLAKSITVFACLTVRAYQVLYNN